MAQNGDCAIGVQGVAGGDTHKRDQEALAAYDEGLKNSTMAVSSRPIRQGSLHVASLLYSSCLISLRSRTRRLIGASWKQQEATYHQTTHLHMASGEEQHAAIARKVPHQAGRISGTF